MRVTNHLRQPTWSRAVSSRQIERRRMGACRWERNPPWVARRVSQSPDRLTTAGGLATTVRDDGSGRWFETMVRDDGSRRWFGTMVRDDGSRRWFEDDGSDNGSGRRTTVPNHGSEPPFRTDVS